MRWALPSANVCKRTAAQGDQISRDILLTQDDSFFLLLATTTHLQTSQALSFGLPRPLLHSSLVSPMEEISCRLPVGLIKSSVCNRKGFATPGWLQAERK